MRQNDKGRHEGGPKLRNHNAPVERPIGSAVNLGRFQDFIVDATQSCQEHCHDKSGRLPDRGYHDRIDRHIPVLDPVELEARPAPALHNCFQSNAGIQKPLPGRSGHDETEGHRVEIYGPDEAFAANFLVEQYCQHQTECTADYNVKTAEYEQVVYGNAPGAQSEELVVILKTYKPEAWQDPAVCEGQVESEKDKAVDKDQDDCQARAEHEFWQKVREFVTKLVAGRYRLFHLERPQEKKGEIIALLFD